MSPPGAGGAVPTRPRAAPSLSRCRDIVELMSRSYADFRLQHSQLAYHFGDEEERDLTAGEVRERWLEHAAAVAGTRPTFNLYVSVPFCPARCHFCVYFQEVPDEPSVLETYHRRLCAQGRFFEPLFRKLPATNAYIGGGSPSLLSESQLDELCDAVFAPAGLRPAGENTAEMHPPSTTPAKLRMLRSVGFNRVSYGVQSLSPEMLRAQGRGYQRPDSVRRVIDAARELGFVEVNADLVCGINGGDPRLFFDSFRGLAEMGPDMISVFPAEPTPGYIDEHYGGDRARFEAEVAREMEGFRRACDWARANGWDWDEKLFPLSYEFYRPGRRPFGRGGYHFELREKGQATLALGSESNSHVFERLRYRTPALHDDAAQVVYRGQAFSPREERRLFLLEHAWHGAPADPALYRELFGGSAQHDFAGELSRLREAGALAAPEQKGFALTGVDRGESFAQSLLLFDPERLARRLGPLLSRRAPTLSVGGRPYNLAFSVRPDGSLSLDLASLEAAGPLERSLAASLRRVLAELPPEAPILEAESRLRQLLERLVPRLSAEGASCQVTWGS